MHRAPRFLITSLIVTASGGCEFKPPDIELNLPEGGLVKLPAGFSFDGGVPVLGENTSLEDILAAGGLAPELAGELAGGAGVGAECEATGEKVCRSGLHCTDGVCEPSGETASGMPCITSAECAKGQCVDNSCQPAGNAEQSEGCRSDGDCAVGLRCGVVGISAQCVPDGTLDLGQPCEQSTECLAGLACAGGSCLPVPGAPPAVPESWSGVDCDPPDTEGPVRAYFELPGADGADEGDYFRLPFPNDALTDSAGRIRLGDFPTPGLNSIVGKDPVAPYVERVNGSKGWGTNPTVSFRFSGPIDFPTIEEGSGVNWVDITDRNNTSRAGISYRTYTGDTRYICHNAVSVRRADGAPLEPGHTYAVWLNTTTRGEDGATAARAPNFEALLKDASPADAVLAAAHEKYLPLREYLDAQEISRDSVLVGTVFTVAKTHAPMIELAEAVNAAPAPTTSDWVQCANGASSPCPQAEGGRACGNGSALYDEYHALVRLPIFQQGEPPYMDTGGAIRAGAPVREEQVCMSLTVPKSTAPEGGWPLVVYGHGTGGSFRGSVKSEVAGALSATGWAPEGGEMVRFAVLGYDQVQHGPRRGESEEHPNNLFFNFLNADAARGNPMQGAADVIALGRLAATLTVPAAVTGGAEVAVNSDSVLYWGHSQGSMHGSLALPLAPQYKAAVFSGNGASLMHALLTKTQPVDVSAVVPVVLGDMDQAGGLPGGVHHPALTLIQQYIDPADPLNFAQQITRSPLEGQTAKHVFQTYGQKDSYSPPLTIAMYGWSGGFALAPAHSSAGKPDDLGPESGELPVGSNVVTEEEPYSAVMRQYGPPSGADGHFVVFDVQDANDDVTHFLAMAAAGQVPSVGK